MYVVHLTLLSQSGESRMLTSYTSSDSVHQSPDHSILPAEADALRTMVEKMQERERRLMDLLKASTPERIEHDLRNVLNELVLLRTLFDPKSSV
jgi:predicted type IV restriction endonuclease